MAMWRPVASLGAVPVSLPGAPEIPEGGKKGKSEIHQPLEKDQDRCIGWVVNIGNMHCRRHRQKRGPELGRWRCTYQMMGASEFLNRNQMLSHPTWENGADESPAVTTHPSMNDIWDQYYSKYGQPHFTGVCHVANHAQLVT